MGIEQHHRFHHHRLNRAKQTATGSNGQCTSAYQKYTVFWVNLCIIFMSVFHLQSYSHFYSQWSVVTSKIWLQISVVTDTNE